MLIFIIFSFEFEDNALRMVEHFCVISLEINLTFTFYKGKSLHRIFYRNGTVVINLIHDLVLFKIKIAVN